MQDKKINLELSFDEVNLILKALGNLPFNQVYDLIGKVHEQANIQVYQNQPENGQDFNLKNDN